LENNDLMCYGIGNGNNFIEIDYNDKQYSVRISVNKDEYFEDIDGDIIIEFYNKIMDKISNGT
jgi:hypothetical protein